MASFTQLKIVLFIPAEKSDFSHTHGPTPLELVLFTDPLSNEANLPCNFDKISCKASEDGEDEVEVELLEALEVAGVLEESTPNKEYSSSFEIEPSLILRWTCLLSISSLDQE